MEIDETKRFEKILEEALKEYSYIEKEKLKQNNKKERYKIENNTFIDTYTNKKYDTEQTLKLLNETEYFRQNCKHERKKLRQTVEKMADVIDGFIALDKLKDEGWI